VRLSCLNKVNCGVVEERPGDFFSFLGTVKCRDVLTSEKIRNVGCGEHARGMKLNPVNTAKPINPSSTPFSKIPTIISPFPL
jgi:hypothetical protein